MATQLEIAREALAQIGTRSKIQSLTDGSAEAQYVNLLYAPIRDFLLREGDYDFSLAGSALETEATIGTVWAFTYGYPIGALRIRQLVPDDLDAIDPRPMEWNVARSEAAPSGLIVMTHKAVSWAHYTVPASEDVWDAMFHQSFVRMLASALAFALENRIEASKQKMEEAMSFAGIANLRDS